MVGDAGFLPAPTVEAFADALDGALLGESPPADPVSVANEYDWHNVVERVKRVYRGTLDSR